MGELAAVHTLWLREIKRFFRMKSRLLGSLGMPFFFLIFLSMAPIRLPGAQTSDYISFLAPGIMSMIVLFGSMGTGVSVLWDKQFGFLKEIMVAPVRRVSIVLGKTVGGVTTALIQGVLILVLSLPLGLKVTGIEPQLTLRGFLAGFLLSTLFMVLIGFTFTSVGLAFASRMKDFQGFTLIWNFFLFPVFLLSGALFPVEIFPPWLRYVAYIDPLTYGVDGLRGSLIGAAQLPLWLDFVALAAASSFTLFMGAYLFNRSQIE